jgi:hypothetical protein
MEIDRIDVLNNLSMEIERIIQNEFPVYDYKIRIYGEIIPIGKHGGD